MRSVYRRRNVGDSNESAEAALEEVVREADDQDWCLVGSEEHPVGKVPFAFPPVRTLCPKCKDVEPFNLDGDKSRAVSLGKPGHQVFSFMVQCQRCKECAIVFLIKRRGRKLQLVGRSEFEEVMVPNFFPSGVRDFYSQAVIAWQSGQPLPALFLLRTLIEQHMRAVTQKAELRGDALCDEYAKGLPSDFSARFPSLKAVYGKLSDALHRADANEELFKSQLQQVQLHFEALALFSKVQPKV